MRKIFIALCTMVSVITGNAQNTPIGENIELAGENPEELKVIYVNKDVSTHFIAMEDIKYVDISVNDIVGDIPTGNSLRIKPTKEGASGVITIVTERFFVQYMLVYSSDLAKAYTRFNIPYADLRSYMNPEVNLTKAQMYDYAHRMFISKNKFYDVSSKSNLMKIVLNNIYTLDKYFFIDISMINKTKLLQKSEMRKNMVMDLIYRGFIYAANYSESHYNPRRSQIKTELRYLFVTTPNR